MNTNGIFRFAYNEISFPINLLEHYDCVFRIDPQQTKIIKPMKNPLITVEEVERQIKRMRTNKAPGPDGIKAELYKVMLENRELVSILTISLNGILEETHIPDDWRVSNTVLIQKKRKPTVYDLRPLALTNTSYKIMMGIIKDKINEHLKVNDLFSELQAGSTPGRRTSDNLLLLQYCIHKTFTQKKKLYIISIDFTKAFDSVNRNSMIQITNFEKY